LSGRETRPIENDPLDFEKVEVGEPTSAGAASPTRGWRWLAPAVVAGVGPPDGGDELDSVLQSGAPESVRSIAADVGDDRGPTSRLALQRLGQRLVSQADRGVSGEERCDAEHEKADRPDPGERGRAGSLAPQGDARGDRQSYRELRRRDGRPARQRSGARGERDEGERRPTCGRGQKVDRAGESRGGEWEDGRDLADVSVFVEKQRVGNESAGRRQRERQREAEP